MRTLLLFALLLTHLCIVAQSRSGKKKELPAPEVARLKLYSLNRVISNGDMEALKEAGTYLDDTSSVEDFLGYHRIPTTVRIIALRILEENCWFAPDKFRFDSTATVSSFRTFLQQHNVFFDQLTGMFLLKHVHEEETTYKIQQLSGYELKNAEENAIRSPFPGWYYENQIDGFLLKKDPQALLWIASAWFHRRTRFNSYYFEEHEFKDLIKKLTHAWVGVPDKTGDFTFLYSDDHSGVAKMNFLRYWARHYQDYEWSNEKGFFVNKREAAEAKTKEEELFPVLSSDNDSLALDAFMQLTELDTAMVRRLSAKYNNSFSSAANRNLPMFPFRFLPQLTLFTKYCRDNGFTYRLSPWLKDSLQLLEDELPFARRYMLENNIIGRLSLDDISAIEYFGITGQRYRLSDYSLGRILDIAYSRMLPQLVRDERQLALFLKKTYWFVQFGIIGNQNKYLNKFAQCPSSYIDKIKQLAAGTTDPVIKQQCSKAIALNSAYNPRQSIAVKPWNGDQQVKKIENLTGEYNRLSRIREKDKRRSALLELISRISYGQLGEAMRLLGQDTAMEAYDRFHFLESDFGFTLNISDTGARNELMENYSKYAEYELYEYYLKQTGLNCFDERGGFNYAGIYDVLKYDVTDAFIGGGGGRRDTGVYLVIKLLELHFKTTLGFPPKRCNSQVIYYCDCTERAAAWMHYLREKGLAGTANDPLSLSPNY